MIQTPASSFNRTSIPLPHASESRSERPPSLTWGVGGPKLAALHPKFQILGIDIGSNIEHCRSTYQFGTWIDHDLDRGEPLPIGRSVLPDSVVVCADVVEHLRHSMSPPSHPGRCIDGSCGSDIDPGSNSNRGDHPPRSSLNPSHIREWTRTEFASLLRWCGFESGYLTYTRPYSGAVELTTILYVLRDSTARG